MLSVQERMSFLQPEAVQALILWLRGISVQNGASTTYTTNALTNGQIVSVIVSNSLGCTATSAGITNTVHALPVATLTSSDTDNSFCAGTSITFTARRRNNIIISG